MSEHFPVKFTLDDGVNVEVNKTGNNTYDFTLKGEDSPERHFTYVEEDRSKDEMMEALDFDQLNAVRRFWLEQEDMD